MGNVLDLARRDANRIVSKMGFETDITLTRGAVAVTVKGIGIVHHLNFDTDGLAVNSKVSRVSVSESTLNAAGFVTRNAKKEVYMKDVIVSFSDSTGLSKTYNVAENFADDTLGIIVLSLQSYAAKQ